MKSHRALTVLLLLALMRSAALAVTVFLSPQKDNTLYEDDPPGHTSNGHGIYLFAGKTGVNGLRRGLIAFDLTAIPANATIMDATLSMFLSTPHKQTDTINMSLSKVLHNWGEGASDAGDPGGQGAQAEVNDATWLHTFYDTMFWTAPGGDFSPTISATTPVSTVDTTYTWSGSGLLADVQSWVSNPAGNFGWVILANEVDAGMAQRLNTRENSSNPPQLMVTYQVSSATPTATATATPTATATSTGTPTATMPPSPTPTATATATPTATGTPTATLPPSPTPTTTPTPTPIPTPTPGCGGTVSLSPQKDNTLYQDPTGQLSNGQGIYLFTGLTDDSELRRGLIAFNLASIPTNATITGATLSMYLSRAGPSQAAVNISLSKAVRDWGEGASDAGSPGGMGAPAEGGDATWVYNFYNTSFWTTPGGDFSPTVSATTPVSTVDRTYTWSGSGLRADVQAWVSNPASNFGWFILANEIDAGSAKRLNTRENTDNPPQLTVTYQLSCATPTPTAAPTPTPTVTPSTFGNISTRLRVETGDNVLIGGFIITGTQPKKVIVRAIGPSLSSFFPGALADPILELRNSTGGLIRSNDNWRSDQAEQIIATTIPPSNELESAIVETLPANGARYTAIVRGVNNTTGIGVVEAYDLDRTVNSKLANISTRGFVQTGDNVLIGGLIVLGQNPVRVIVRAIGPSLPVPGALADPTLELYNGNGTLIAANDNWRTNQEAEIIATTIPPSNDLESAIVQNFTSGNYTAIVRGVNSTTGIAVVEAYALN